MGPPCHAGAGDRLDVSCFHRLVALRVDAARRRMQVVGTAAVSGRPPVVAGGVVGTVERSCGLEGSRRGDGRRVALGATPDPDAVTSFRILRAPGAEPAVPAGRRGPAYAGA